VTLETACKAVDFVTGLPLNGKQLDLGFFGGEPLLRFDLIQAVVAYVEQKPLQVSGNIAYFITTNGTLLTPEIIAFFQRKNFSLCVSLDGPERIHDRERLYHNGRGSFQKVFENLQMAVGIVNRLQVNSVYSPETVEFMPEILDFFINSGLKVVHFNPNIYSKWTKDAKPAIVNAFNQVAEQYIDCYRHGCELAVNFLDSKMIVLFKDGFTPDDICGMGSTEWGFAPSGNVYPCERFIGEDTDTSLCMGNVHHGINPVKRCQILNQRGNHNPECQVCDLKKFCMNWCGCSNYFQTGHADMAGAMMCMIEQSAIEAAQKVFITLTQEGNDLFLNHMLAYANSEINYRMI
jgi:uncharacterized protein